MLHPGTSLTIALLSCCTALAQQSTFSTTIQPLLRQNCAMCHNKAMASGGLNLDGLNSHSSIAQEREAWERIIAKMRTGEMPPKGAPKPPPEQVHALIQFVNAELDRIDRARPPDDSVLGFDNIGDVLTISPLLMEKYVHAAERIAALAIAADGLPKPTLFELKADRTRRLDNGASDITEHLDYSGEYVFRVRIRGHLGPKGQPASLQISVDGKPIHTVEVDTAENETSTVARDIQRSEQEARVYLTAGPHTFRAEFVGDQFRKPVPRPPAGRTFTARQTDPMIYPEKFACRFQEPS